MAAKLEKAIYAGPESDPELDIETDLRQVAYLLAQQNPQFPAEWAHLPSVRKYLKARYGNQDGDSDSGPEILSRKEILAAYEKDLARHCAEAWARNSMNRIRAFDKMVPGGATRATPALVNKFLSRVLDRTSPATRNRTYTALSRFFKWCLIEGHVTATPCVGIKLLREADLEEIAYCTRDERARVLAAAQALGRPDWVAVPIAMYAGCRREEIFRLRWEDINFSTKRLTIRKSKNGRKRTTPMAKELVEILEKERQERGPVVPNILAETWQNQADRLVELIRDRLCRPENPDLTGHASEPIGKWRYLASEDDFAGIPARVKALETQLKKTKKHLQKHRLVAILLAGQTLCPAVAYDGGPWMPAERIGWNAWRHTFATLRAQAGVSLDKISSWMGNTFSVCKKHYTQFMPRDEHDEDIDKL